MFLLTRQFESPISRNLQPAIRTVIKDVITDFVTYAQAPRFGEELARAQR